MAWIPGGAFTMGAEGFYPEEAPTRKVTVDGFYDDVLPFAPAALKMMQEVPDDSESKRWSGS